MSSTNRRRLDKTPSRLNAATRTNRTVRVELTQRETPDTWLLARAFLSLVAYQRKQQEAGSHIREPSSHENEDT